MKVALQSLADSVVQRSSDNLFHGIGAVTPNAEAVDAKCCLRSTSMQLVYSTRTKWMAGLPGHI